MKSAIPCHTPPPAVRSLKNSAFDLMTGSTISPTTPLRRFNLFLYYNRLENIRENCLGLEPGGKQAGNCARRRAWPSWDTGRRAAAQAAAARFRPALLAHRVRRPTRRQGPGALPPTRTNPARQRDRAACATGRIAPDRFGSRTGNRAFDRGAVIAIPRRPPMDRHTGSGRFARPGRRRP